MRDFLKIEQINALEVLDSRGKPTVQVEVITEGGFCCVGLVPSGASTGTFEAVELRDNDLTRYQGNGVKKAIENIDRRISKKLEGKNVYEQIKIDSYLIELDGIGGTNANQMPTPMMNILNGGKHSDNNINIQEFMIVPISGQSFSDKLKMGVETYHHLKNVLKQNGYSTSVGDEGGFAPNLQNEEEALDSIVKAIIKAGYVPGVDIALALDVASTEMFKESQKINQEGYYFWKTSQYKTTEEMIGYLENLVNKYPIISIEDGLAEEDWTGWQELTKRLNNKIQLVGDDLFVTNLERVHKGINKNVANSVLIKPNQVGTLTETLDTIELAKRNGYKIIISHRSGETEDTTISDIAVRN